MRIIYDDNGRAISVETDFLDSLLGTKVDETADSYVIKYGLFGKQKRILKSRLNVHRSIVEKHEDVMITIGNKEYKLNDLPPELRKKLGL